MFYDYYVGYNILKLFLLINGSKLFGWKNFVFDGGCVNRVLMMVMFGDELILVFVLFEGCEVICYWGLDGSWFVDVLFDDVVIDEEMIFFCGVKVECVVSKMVVWL